MLARFQDLFVRLCADAALRARFRADPAAVLDEADLGERERRALLGIPGDALERYARSLVEKRAREVAKVLPLTRRVAPSVLARYRAFLEQSPAEVADPALDPGAAEALRALSHLCRALRDDEGEAPYAPALLAFEVLRAASRADGQVRTLRCRYRADLLARDVEEGQLPVDPEPAPCLFRFSRAGMKVRCKEEP